jgi:hypothetical protein
MQELKTKMKALERLLREEGIEPEGLFHLAGFSSVSQHMSDEMVTSERFSNNAEVRLTHQERMLSSISELHLSPESFNTGSVQVDRVPNPGRLPVEISHPAMDNGSGTNSPLQNKETKEVIWTGIADVSEIRESEVTEVPVKKVKIQEEKEAEVIFDMSEFEDIPEENRSGRSELFAV